MNLIIGKKFNIRWIIIDRYLNKNILIKFHISEINLPFGPGNPCNPCLPGSPGSPVSPKKQKLLLD